MSSSYQDRHGPVRLLVVLQNAYDRGELAEGWHPGRWRREFRASRTGRRLLGLVPSSWRVHYANACPGIGNGTSSCLRPCQRHLRRALRRVRPDVILACGRLAEDAALAVWHGPLFAIPHPASRVVTNKLLLRCRRALLRWSETAVPETPRVAFRLEKGLILGRRTELTVAAGA